MGEVLIAPSEVGPLVTCWFEIEDVIGFAMMACYNPDTCYFGWIQATPSLKDVMFSNREFKPWFFHISKRCPHKKQIHPPPPPPNTVIAEKNKRKNISLFLCSRLSLYIYIYLYIPLSFFFLSLFLYLSPRASLSLSLCPQRVLNPCLRRFAFFVFQDSASLDRWMTGKVRLLAVLGRSSWRQDESKQGLRIGRRPLWSPQRLLAAGLLIGCLVVVGNECHNDEHFATSITIVTTSISDREKFSTNCFLRFGAR